MDNLLAIGRMVRVIFGYDIGARPAVVTEINEDGTINGTAFITSEDHDKLSLPGYRMNGTITVHTLVHDNDKHIGTWHWPERS